MMATSPAASEHICVYWSILLQVQGFVTNIDPLVTDVTTSLFPWQGCMAYPRTHRQNQLSSVTVISVLDMPASPQLGAWCRHRLVHGAHHHAYVFSVVP